ncbi:MFS transporter [Terrihabitans sp. B22-R8]|uniref:MFS transporter n=1 Tax=Terrihabitans sp. B22-R8 TaxID=3425128 RepID=UPI00403C1DF2
MSAFEGNALARAGHLACFCGEDVTPGERPWRQPGLLSLALGFGLAVLAQALVFGILPLAGAQLAPSPGLVGLPFAAMLVGAVAATLPASLLLDHFGRRAAFALGASLGLAGALMLSFALVEQRFVLLCLGAFWLGIAQGFGLFYRHAAALGPGGAPASTAIIFGAGLLAAFVGPWIATFAEALAAPYFLVGTAFAAAAVQIAALSLAVSIPAPPVSLQTEERPRALSGALWKAIAISAPAWAIMYASMAHAPLAMIDCGIAAGGVAGLVAWHLLAMYAPSLAIPALARFAGAMPLAATGLVMAVLGAIGINLSQQVFGFALALALVGAGWSFAVAGATMALHASGRPSAWMLAGHDALCLLAALAAVLAMGALFS